jgi:guanylate kinase
MKRLKKKPVWMVVSAPSGAGKTTLCKRLMQEFPDIYYSVSCTTRPPRVTEVNGESYHFISPSEFEQKVERGAFLEHADVHGFQYGTLRVTVIEALARGVDVLMDIDVQGAAQIRRSLLKPDCSDILKNSYADVFVAPPSVEVLRERLLHRGEDAEDVIDRRVAKAQDEMARWYDYMYVVINDRIDDAYDVFRSVYVSSHYRT